MLNPDPLTYRLTEVCLVCGSERAFPALLARRRPVRARLKTRLRDASSDHVLPYMTRDMLAVLIRDVGLDSEIQGSLGVEWRGEASPALRHAERRRLRPDARGLYAIGEFSGSATTTGRGSRSRRRGQGER